jgi:hypothetical protein
MRFICIILLFQLSLISSAQVINSLSKNQTGFYTHALDSVLSIIKKEKVLHTIFIAGKECVKDYLPNTLQGVTIVWLHPTSRKKKKERPALKADEMLVLIQCLYIIRNEVVVRVFTPREGAQLYEFQYYYQPDTADYKLKFVKRGIIL